MGYTRYYTVVNKSSLKTEFIKKVKQVISIAQNQYNIVIKGWDGHTKPVINNTKISLNGDGSNDLECETFLISINKPGFETCKTRQYPYDMVVKVILKLAQHYGYVRDVMCDGESLYDQQADAIFATILGGSK